MDVGWRSGWSELCQSARKGGRKGSRAAHDRATSRRGPGWFLVDLWRDEGALDQFESVRTVDLSVSPDEDVATKWEDSLDLGEGPVGLVPVVHGQGADDDIECPIGEWQPCYIGDLERRRIRLVVTEEGGVGAGLLDHGRVEVDTGHIKPALGELVAEMTGSTAEVEDSRWFEARRPQCRRRFACQRFEDPPANGVVDGRVVDECATGWVMTFAARSSMSYHSRGKD